MAGRAAATPRVKRAKSGAAKAASRKRAAAPPADSAAVVRNILEGYAKRGVFAEFGESAEPDGTFVFRFRWYHNARLELAYEARALTFRRLLPNISPGGAMEGELRMFLSRIASPKALAHRRIDPRRARVVCNNAKRTVSIGLEFGAGKEEYTARKVVNLAAEIFTRFLTGPYYDYMAKHFGVRDE